jgi:PilZ domain
VTDPISTSKSARESLARGLNALQADPSVPPALVELAAPIAQAMGALHQIERTQQVVPHADTALTHLRGALAQLQAQPTNHPAVTQALDAVAGSLSLVHALSRMANGPQPGALAATQAAPPTAPVPVAAQVAPPVKTQAIPQKAPPAQGSQPQLQQPPQQQAFAPQPAPQHAAPQQQQQHTAPQPQHPQFTGPQHQQPPPQQQHTAPQPMAPRISNPQPSFPQGAPQGGPPMVARDPFAAPGGHMPSGPGPMPSGGVPPATPSMPVPAPPAGNLQLVNADLGAHSPTNFFKGLSGNDIIDHGGLFVSTYILPKIGHPVRLKVSLPGGYEFEANAVVKWTREDGGGDVPPGFGAQFTQITPEARQLVYRYVRNREPMFYDDL